jgi:hypothetical protein
LAKIVFRDACSTAFFQSAIFPSMATVLGRMCRHVVARLNADPFDLMASASTKVDRVFVTLLRGQPRASAIVSIFAVRTSLR